MRFEKYLGADVLGCYRPGSVISIDARIDAGRRNATVIHETTHLGVTSASTLGVVGVLCGLPMVYSKDPKERAAAGEYVKRLCTLSFWVQEGAATASEVAWDLLTPLAKQANVSFELLVKPSKTYYKAALDILNFAFPIALSINKEHLSYTVQAELLARSVQAVAISAMSPPVDDSFIRAALLGHSFGYLETLRSHWSRFLSIIHLPIKSLTESVGECLPTEIKPEYVSFDFKLDLAKIICEFAGLDYGGLLNARDLAKEYVPDLADHVQGYDAKQTFQNDILRHYATGKYHNIIPERIVATDTDVFELSKIETMASSGILIAEVIAMSEGDTSIIIHSFDEAANYLQSLSLRHNRTRELLGQIVKHIISRHKSACSGIVVDLEVALNQIGSLLEGMPVVALPCFGVAPSEIEQLDRVCSNEHVELHRILLDDENVCWQVVGVDSTEPCRQMNLDESCYSWVLSNGFAAQARWKLQYD